MIHHYATVPESGNAIDALLDHLTLTGSFFCHNEWSGSWRTAFPSVGHLTLHVPLVGACDLEVEGKPPLRLNTDDLALLPCGLAHGFSDVFENSLLDGNNQPKSTVSVTPGADTRTVLVCGGARLDGPAHRLLITALPDVVYLPAQGRNEKSLKQLISLLSDELLGAAATSSAVTHRLFELVLLHALREWLAYCDQPTAWLAAARDPRIGRALTAIHTDAEKPWTLTALASVAGMSRSALSERFKTFLGQSPIQYLTEWRMQLAARWLSEPRQTVSRVAERLGYESEPAFSRAFSRHMGYPPGGARNRYRVRHVQVDDVGLDLRSP